MGNTTATLTVKLDSQHDRPGRVTLQAGQEVKGSVHVDLSHFDSTTRSVSDYALCLIVCGKEKSHHSGIQALRKNITRSPNRAERQVFWLQYTLQDFKDFKNQDVMHPSENMFPFRFDLPATLPSSMRCVSGLSWCKISYKIRAEIILNSALAEVKPVNAAVAAKNAKSRQSGRFLWCEQDLWVKSAPRQAELVPWTMEPVTYEVKAFGLVGKGTISFGVALNNTHVNRGDDLKFSFACRNNSGVDMQDVLLSIIEKVTWKIEDGSQTTRCLKVPLAMETMEHFEDAIMESRDTLYFRSTMTSLDQLHAENREGLYLDLIHGTHTTAVCVPGHAMDSYVGTLIQCEHFLEVKVRVKTAEFFNDPTVRVPLKVMNYSAPTKLNSAPMPESGYEPETPTPATEKSLNNSITEQNQRAEVLPPAEAPPVSESTPLDHSVSVLEDIIWTRPDDAAETSTGRIRRQSRVVHIPNSAMRAGGRSVRLLSFIEPSGLVDASDSTIYTNDLSDAEGSEEDNWVEDYKDEHFPSLPNLIEEMSSSLDDFDVISSKLESVEWRAIFAALTPTEFGIIIAHVKQDFDQPKVAECLASHLLVETGTFSCDYCLSALNAAASWNRIPMVQRLLAFCTDVAEYHEIISSELTPWELNIMGDDFTNALNSSFQFHD